MVMGQPCEREESVSQAKPFTISKQLVWEAYKRVKANQGAAGIDSESVEQFERIREMLARVELTDGLDFPRFVLEVMPRLPRDATVIAILGDVTIETAVSLSNLLRQGFAVSVILIGFDPEKIEKAYGHLLSQGLRDLRHLPR